MIYALQQDASGKTIKCSSWSSLPVDEAGAPVLDAGYVQCDEAAYRAAVTAMRSTLPIQAANALRALQPEAAMAAAMGQTFSVDMRNYVTALQAIAGGTDTTSTVLPVRPAA